jgi:hypothetical protein
MTTVYLVVDNPDGDGYSVVGVCSTPEKAEKLMELRSDCDHYMEVKKLIVDDHVDRVSNCERLYRVDYDSYKDPHASAIVRCRTYDQAHGDISKLRDGCVVYVWAKTPNGAEEAAFKIRAAAMQETILDLDL